jgi:hypothetical protein
MREVFSSLILIFQCSHQAALEYSENVAVLEHCHQQKGARLLNVRITLRLMVGQSVSLGVEPHEIFITV